MKKILLRVLGVLVVFLLLIQLVPYGHNHTNPPVVAEPKWDSPQTRTLAARACFDCHSNETVWPWYSNVAPVSWLIARDVEEGRSKLNFSGPSEGAGGEGGEGEGGEGGEGEGGERGGESDDVAGLIRSGEMPPWYFLVLHPNAKLTTAEKEALISGLQASGVKGD